MNLVLVITSIVTASAVLIYTVFAGLQWWAIRRQAEHTASQAVEMQGQLDEMKRQAGFMEEGLNETRKLVAHNEQIVQAMQGQLVAMKQQAAASEAQFNVAGLAVQVAEKGAIYAQRAYLSVTKGEIRGSGFLLRIENSGNSPANDVQMKAVAQMRSGALPVPDPGATGSYSYFGLIAPSGHFEAEVISDPELSGAEQDKLIQSGMEWWCAGTIRYEDVFGKTRHTKFCFSRHWLSDSLQPWVEGNEAD